LSLLSVIAAARARQVERRPFRIGPHRVGDVARADCAELRAFDAIEQGPEGVRLAVAPEQRDSTLATINHRLRERGLIRAWRDEVYAIVDPATLMPLARIERAASRFWGTLTFGAHATGYLADAHGRPTHLWIAQRAFDKATDPGMLDNLIGGGVPHDQSPQQALLREAWEEAGLKEPLARRAQPAAVLELRRDIAEGLQFERLHSFDLELTADVVPANQDGEVAAFTLAPVAELIATELWTRMTVDAAVVTIDFLLRHRLLADPAAAAAMAGITVLRSAATGAPQVLGVREPR
jgi:8-oxo-dGTP pyrophosphatase MutT (NUDIX family)